MGKRYRRHRAVGFREFLKLVAAAVPPDLEIHSALVNYGTHKTAVVHDWLAMHPHFRLQFTRTSASWINQVERRFADPNPFVWRNSADPILESPNSFRQKIYETGH